MNSYIDFKKVITERVFIPKGKEEEALKLIKEQSTVFANNMMTNIFLWKWENLDESEEILNPEELKITIEMYVPGERNEMDLK